MARRIPPIRETVLSYHRPAQEDPNHRYRSWEHCYRHFRNHADMQAEAQIDLAALHLGFYLASWGMYRGSSFLLWKDYRVHVPVVRSLMQERYAPLWDVDFSRARGAEESTNLILQLCEALRGRYAATAPPVHRNPAPPLVTDTLVTKVLLGTMGCVPASDQYVIAGLRAIGLPYSCLNARHLARMADFYREHDEAFKAVAGEVSPPDCPYPAMKLVDMYFWRIGVAAQGGPQL